MSRAPHTKPVPADSSATERARRASRGLGEGAGFHTLAGGWAAAARPLPARAAGDVVGSAEMVVV